MIAEMVAGIHCTDVEEESGTHFDAAYQRVGQILVDRVLMDV